jgi:hypothetical protein
MAISLAGSSLLIVERCSHGGGLPEVEEVERGVMGGKMPLGGVMT